MLTLRGLAKHSLNAAPILSVTKRNFSSANPNPSISPAQSPAHYDDLINAAGRSRDFATVARLLTQRITNGCYNTSRTFKFVATDVSMLEDLLQHLDALDDWFTRKHAHDSLVAQLSKLHRTSEALLVAEKMVTKKYGATGTTFYPIINALVRKKKIPAAWNVFDVMRRSDLKPDTTAFNYILTAYCYLGDVTSAAEVLSKMEEEGLRADARTYDALVLGACRAGKVGGALWVVRRMMEDGMEGLYSTHAHAITAMVRRGYVAQAVEYVRILAGRKEKLDVENFGYLGRRLRIAKRVEEAKLVAEEMGRRGLPICDELNQLMDLRSH